MGVSAKDQAEVAALGTGGDGFRAGLVDALLGYVFQKVNKVVLRRAVAEEDAVDCRCGG